MHVGLSLPRPFLGIWSNPVASNRDRHPITRACYVSDQSLEQLPCLLSSFLSNFSFKFSFKSLDPRSDSTFSKGRDIFLNFLTAASWPCCDANLAILCFSCFPYTCFLFWSLPTCTQQWYIVVDFPLRIHMQQHSWNPPPPFIRGGGRTFKKLSHLGGYQILC